MADTPNPLKPANIPGQNPNTPQRMPGHTGFYEDGEGDEAETVVHQSMSSVTGKQTPYAFGASELDPRTLGRAI